ncbi:hypothetical protein AAK899_07035 [Erysipelotrichaceae bacterium 51-3]
MKKLLKIILIFVIVMAVILVGLWIYLKNKPAIPNHYQSEVQTGGKIEARYLADGSYETAWLEQPALQEFKKYEIAYPVNLETTDRQYPVIVLCNGSGTPLSKYSRLARHYASWGFIVIGTEEMYAWNGFGADMCVSHLRRLNENKQIEENKENIFYQKVNLSSVGIVGHSQGGVGVFNAITEGKNKEVYKAAAALSPTNMELAHNLEWNYDAAKIQTPILLASGEGGGDDWVVTGDQLTAIANEISAPKVQFRRKKTAHDQMLYAADGYVTAWFLWLLQDDPQAAKAFVTPQGELLSNPLYTNQEANLNSLAFHS